MALLIEIIEALIPALSLIFYLLSIQDIDHMIRTSDSYGKGVFYKPPVKDQFTHIVPPFEGLHYIKLQVGPDPVHLCVCLSSVEFQPTLVKT